MASSVLRGNRSASIQQNWVITPAVDLIFIIAAPVIALIWAIVTLAYTDALGVMMIFGVFNVAHHFPTFIRIYGDRNLMQRFKWRLLLGPIIPFTFFMTVVALGIQAGIPITSLVFLFLVVSIWDPWHFLMQHYGFVRIYDRHNLAPQKLASRMDSLICWSWFIYIMIAAVDWFPNILYKLYNDHRFAVMTLFDSGVYPLISRLAFGFAIASTVAYAVYLVWCKRNGYYISYAKLLLIVITFGMMCLTYIPNRVMASIAPNWSFELGFATLGMVHVTQYLAIVWKYNRGLVKRPDSDRPGIFASLFSRGGLTVIVLYCFVCLAYGFVLQRGMHMIGIGSFKDSQLAAWIAGVFLATGFTSTILHYYYDGFIWKFRHKENRENLGLKPAVEPKAATANQSWWNNAQEESAALVLFRQAAYFALPMALLAVSYALVTAFPARPEEQLQTAVELYQSGLVQEGRTQLDVAFTTIDEKIDVERRMIEVRPRAIHYAVIAELLYWKSSAKRDFLSEGDESTGGSDYSDDLRQAISAHESALQLSSSSSPQVRKQIEQKLKPLRNSFAAND